MSSDKAKIVVGVLDDLFFTVKIADAAKRAGLAAAFVNTEAAILARLRQEAAVVVIDLHCAAVDAIGLTKRIKEDFPATTVIGFVSHVQTEVRQKALAAGCDKVLARSAMAAQLPQLLSDYAS
jgi:CheY-like chemotaxis protein